MPSILASFGQRKLLDYLTPSWEYTPRGSANYSQRFWPRFEDTMIHPVNSLWSDLPRQLVSDDPTMLLKEVKPGVYGFDLKGAQVGDLNTSIHELNAIQKNYLNKTKDVKLPPGMFVVTPNASVKTMPFSKTITSAPHPVSLAQAAAKQRTLWSTDFFPMVDMANNTGKIMAKGLGALVPSAMIADIWLRKNNPGLENSTAYNLLTKYGPETYLGGALLGNAGDAISMARARSYLPETMPLHRYMMKSQMLKNVGKIGLGYGALALGRYFINRERNKEASIQKQAIDPRMLMMADKAAPYIPPAIALLGLGLILKSINKHMDEKPAETHENTSFHTMLRHNYGALSPIERGMTFGTPEVFG
jgi:hypothetical protein